MGSNGRNVQVNIFLRGIYETGFTFVRIRLRAAEFKVEYLRRAIRPTLSWEVMSTFPIRDSRGTDYGRVLAANLVWGRRVGSYQGEFDST